MHALLFANDANTSGNLNVIKPRLGGDSVDLGGFRQLTHQSKVENRVTLNFHISAPAKPESGEWDLSDISVAATYGIRTAMEKPEIAEHRELVEELFVNEAGEIAGDFGEVRRYRQFMERLAAKAAELGNDPPSLLSFEISMGGKRLLRASGKRKSIKLDAIVSDHPAMDRYIRVLLEQTALSPEIGEKELLFAREVINGIVADLELEMAGLLPRPQSRRNDGILPPAITGLRTQSEVAAEQLRLFLTFRIESLISAVHEACSQFLGKIRYLGPLRSYPPRHLAFTEMDDVDALGAFAWKALRDDAALRAKVNNWLGQHYLQVKYELSVDSLISSALTAEAVEASVEDVLAEKIQEFEEARGRMGDKAADELFFNPYDAWDDNLIIKRLLGEIALRTAAENANQELVLRDKRNNVYVSHRDIGIGISQVLPVLAHSYASRNAVIAIEQPEIHLHPALQAELADVFIESALGEQKNTLLLETHSEHLILRLLRRIRETASGELPAA